MSEEKKISSDVGCAGRAAQDIVDWQSHAMIATKLQVLELAQRANRIMGNVINVDVVEETYDRYIKKLGL